MSQLKLYNDLYSLYDDIELALGLINRAYHLTTDFEKGLSPEQLADVHYYLRRAYDRHLPSAIALHKQVATTIHNRFVKNPYKPRICSINLPKTMTEITEPATTTVETDDYITSAIANPEVSRDEMHMLNDMIEMSETLHRAMKSAMGATHMLEVNDGKELTPIQQQKVLHCTSTVSGILLPKLLSLHDDLAATLHKHFAALKDTTKSKLQ